MNRKVYISGMGLVSSLGKDSLSTFDNILSNQTNTKVIKEWMEISPLKSKIASEVSNWDNKFISRHHRRTMSKMSEMICLAYDQARIQSNIDSHLLRHSKASMIVGSTAGSQSNADEFFTNLKQREESFPYCQSFMKTMGHSLSMNLAIYSDYNGPVINVSAACATSSQAIVMAAEYIKAGIYDLVICGGADELDPYSAMVFDNAGVSTLKGNLSPSLYPKPFDEDRDGLVLSEGAAIVVLESEDHLIKRGAQPLIEVLSGGHSRNGNNPVANPVDGMIQNMISTLKLANLKKENIDYINAHATGTVTGDLMEMEALLSVFNNTNAKISSLKGHLGHSLAANGGIEVILTTLMMNKKMLLPTKNLTKIPYEFSTLNFLKENKKFEPHISMVNNYGFGGVNTSIILKKV